DWNNDGTLSHPQEWVFTSDSGHFHTGVIPTPTNAVTGTYLRMRVRGGYYTNIDPCDSLTFGEVEDYAVYVWPELTISITHNDATNSNCDGDATANISGGRPVISYQWDDVNNQTTQTATGLCAGTYHVTVTDGNGCYIEDSVVIQTVTGIDEEVGTFSLNVFPNPGEGNFSVEMWPLLPGAEVQLVLTNVYGAVVREQTLSATALHQTVQFDRQGLAAGCYLLECRSGVFLKRVRLIMH
ncbi:MAG: GEVED domain-containing protein, partial [Flavobacteriales bacterium]